MQSETAPWSATIRRQVLQLIALLVSLVLIGAGYDIWSHESIEHIERKTTRNHLLTTSHYLKAMEELRNIQNHHAMHSMQSMHHGEVEDIRSSLQMSDSQHDSKHYLVHQRINQALELEQEIADPRFNALSARLKQQIALFEVNFKAYQAGHPINVVS